MALMTSRPSPAHKTLGPHSIHNSPEKSSDAFFTFELASHPEWVKNDK
jgi:hypothetical protein